MEVVGGLVVKQLNIMLKSIDQVKTFVNEVSGIDKLSLELKDSYLVISAAKGLDKDEKEKETGKFVRRERYVGSMSRSFYVGEDVKQEDILAKYENGVLKLSIPKAETKKPEIEEKKYIAIEG